MNCRGVDLGKIVVHPVAAQLLDQLLWYQACMDNKQMSQ